MQQPVSAPRSFRPSVLFGHLQNAYRTMRGAAAAPAPVPRRRKVTFEVVEPRLLLSADLLPGLGGDDANAVAPPTQVFYIDADGAQQVDYRGPVLIEGIDVAAFMTSGALAGQETAVLQATLAHLDDLALGPNVRFTTERPTDGAFSTIYLGGDGAAFAPWGHFYGLAEDADIGNLDAADDAFVFSDNMSFEGLSAQDAAAQLATTIAHEAGHLLGTAAAHESHDGNPLAALAFDPKVHVAIATDAADDAVDNGKVTINIGGTDFEYTVHPLIVAALTQWRDYYNGGAVAGDGFPDVLMGQIAIHPVDHATWLTRVLDMAWKAQQDASFTADEKSQILAWTYGFLTHSAADHWAHTLVNSFAEGVAPGSGAAAVSLPGDQRDLGNMLRHFMTEGYIADSLPGFDADKAERTLIDDKGTVDPNDDDYSDDSTPAIAYAAPVRFIYETFIRAFPDDPTSVVEMDWDKGELVADAATDSFTRTDIGLLGAIGYNGFEHDGFKVGQKITVAGFGNAANNGTFLITAVTPTKLTVSGALADETASGDETIVVRPARTAEFGAGQLVVDAETNTFARSDAGGSFVADGFVAGMRFDALGMTGNAGNYIVKAVTNTTLTVVGGLADATHRGELVDETGGAGVRLVGVGQRGPLLDNMFKLRASVLEKAVEKGARSTDTNDLGTLAGQLIDKLVTGQTITDAFKTDIYRAYLYNWVDEIDEGVRHWGELGLAFAKALFDAGSRRELQEKVGAATGFVDSADSATIRSKAEDGIGVIDVLLAELDDPNGDGSTFDSFINKHLLPMIGLPAELGLLRSALQGFASELSTILEPVAGTLNPAEPAPDEPLGFVKSFLKGQLEKRFGIDFDFFEQLRGLSNKMDLESVTIAGQLVPVFKPGDHERLDKLLGLPVSGHHGTVKPQNVTTGPFQLKFFADAEGGLNDTAVMDKTAFDAYANAVTLSKMALLMESPATDPVAGTVNPASPDADKDAAGELSDLYGDILTKLNGAPTTYDFSQLNLNGAHGGNVLTATLPGAPGSATGRPWLTSIDADQIWRADNYTVNNTLYRISEFTDGANSPSLVEYTATGLAAGDYRVYASWQGNVTQDLDNLENSAFPDQKMVPTDKAQYSVSVAGGASLTFQLDQSQFANDLDHEGLAFEQLRTAAEATAKTDHPFTITAGQTLKVTLSNVTGGGNQHVIAGPILLVRVSDGAKFRIQNNRDPQTLAPVATPGFTYNETVPAAWSDVVYSGGSGNDPLWESATLRPVFRALFDDWQNGGLDFPDLGDTTTSQATSSAAAKVELASHATAFGPKIADHTLEVPITATLEAAILGGLQGVVDFAHGIETAAPLQVKIPGIDKSLAELVNLSGTVHDRVQQPIVDFFAGDVTPTFEELFDVISPSLGSWNAADGSAFEFDLDLGKAFAANLPLHLGDGADGFGLELDGQLDVGALFAFVDTATRTLPHFVFGVDLTQDVASSFYIRAETLLLHAEAHSADLDFGAHLGFLSVGVTDGTIDFDADVSVDLSVLDANADQRITLAEITANLALIDVATSGTLDGTLPITIEALSGLTDLNAGTVTFGATDIFDTATYEFDFTGLDTDALNFGNIDAAGIVSLIGRLADELDKLRDSGFFDKVDVPLVGGAIDGVLGFADVLTSGLLYDKGADGVKDGADRLAFDLNAALDTAGLGSVLIVQGTGNTLVNTNKLLFQIIDPTVDTFKIERESGALADFTSAGLGFVVGDADDFTATHLATPADGVIAGDIKLRITLDRAGTLEVVFVTISAASTANNLAVANAHQGIGDDTIKLLRADNSATFDTAQSLVFRLDTMLSLDGALAYDPSTDALTLNLGALLPKLEFVKELPIDFNLDLGPLIGIKSDTKVNVTASVGFDDGFTLGVYLGKTVPGAQANLSDGSGPTPATLLATLNDGAGVAIETAPALTAPGSVISAIRQLTGDATFEIAFGNEDSGAATGGSTGTLLENNAGGHSFSGKVGVGDTVFNLTDGSSAKVIGVQATQLVLTALKGGVKNTWEAGNLYRTAHLVTVDALGDQGGTDVNVSKEGGDQSETAIAVNPLNPKNIVIGANNLNSTTTDFVWVSIDGGANWVRRAIPIPAGGNGNAVGDPALVFSRDGSRLVFTHMIQKTNGKEVIASAVSFDGGLTWNAADTRVVGSLALDEDADGFLDGNDKNYIAVGPDPTNLNRDLFIVTWQRHNVIYSSVSSDGLAWGAPVVVGGLNAGSSLAAPSGTSIDAIPSFGPDGKIYVAWEDFGTSGVSQIKFDVSIDGGKTWGNGADRSVFFETADSTLDATDRATLNTIVNAMASNPTMIATVAGYTDTAGLATDNQALSDARATAVFNYLVAQGISASRLTQLGFGESHLKVATADGVASAANRRVEVTLDRVIYTGNVNVFRDAFGTVAGQGLDGVDETSSPVGLGEYEIPAQPDRGIWMGLSIDVDRSGGAHDGRIYIAFTDQGDLDGLPDNLNAVDHADTDIFILASDDDGGSWNALGATPTRVNDDTGHASQFFGWLDVDDATGVVAVSWYDARNDMDAVKDVGEFDAIANTDVQYFAAISRDFGATWGANIQVSDGRSNVTSGVAGANTALNQYGDYSALALVGGTVFMAWADNSDSTGDHVPVPVAGTRSTEVYFDRIELANTTVQDLLDDINAALGHVAALGGRIEAVATGNRIGLQAADIGVAGFTLSAAQSDPAVKDLGFNKAQAATGPLVGDVLDTFKLTSGDAVFTLTIGGTDHVVTVTKLATAGLTTIDALVGVVNTALATAGVGTKVAADKAGNALVLRIKDATLATVGFKAAIDNPTVLELGLTNEATITQPRIVAVKDVPFVVGRLAQDATLTITTNGASPGSVTLYADDTATNTSIVSLVSDLNKALATPTLKSGVLTTFAPASVVFQIGLNGAAPTPISIGAAALADNETLSDLVEDINAALVLAGLGDDIKAKSSGAGSDLGRARVKFEAANASVLTITAAAGNGLGLPLTASATNYSGKLVADSSGSRLVITAVGGTVTAFTVAADAGAQALGLAAGPTAADNVDFDIQVANGTVYHVTLTAVTDIAGVMAAIQSATGGLVQVEVNDSGTGLTLIDTTFADATPNVARFMVTPVNGSGAATGLGIAGVDSTVDAELDGRIDGGQLVGIQLTDRFFMNHATLTATLDIATVGPVSADANFGFVGIHLGGSAAFSAELSVGLKDPTATGPGADGNISLREFINGLPDFSSALLATPTLTGGGQVKLDVTVTGLDFLNLPAPGSLNAPTVTLDLLNLGDVFNTFADGPVALTGAVRAADGKSFTLSGDHTAELTRGSRIALGANFNTFATEVTFAAGTNLTTVKVASHDALLPASLAGLTAATPILPAIDLQFDNFDKLLSFQNVSFDFASIVDALLLIRDLLSQIDGASGVLNTPIPLVDVSINDLLNFVDTFSEALTQAQKNPAGSLQLLDQVISDAFGVVTHPAAGLPDLIDFEIDDHLLLGDTSDDLVKIKLDLGAAFSKSLNVRIPDLNLPSGLVDFGGAATLSAEGSGHFYLDLGIGLNNPSQIYLYDTSRLEGALKLSGSDMSFKAGLGPLSLSIIDGEASIDGKLKVFFDFDKTGDTVVADAGGRVLLTGQLGAVLGTLDASFAAPVDVTLPIFFPTESHGIGDITLKGDLKNIANGLALKTDGTAAPADTIVLDVSHVLEGLTSGLANLSLLDQILFIVDGVDVVLGGVQDTLDGEVMGITLPLIGDKLAGAADVVGDFRTGFLNDFRKEVEKLADPSENGIKDILFKLLGDSGLLIAVDQNGDAVKQPGGQFVAGTKNDIRSFNNLAEVNNIADAEIWWKVKIGQNLVDAGADIGLDIGIPGLGLETDGEIKLNIDWELDLGFGLSGKDGFFFFVDDPDELMLDVGVTLPGGSLSGTLGFLQFTALNKDVNGDGDQTHLSASFAIDISNGDDATDTRLGLSELGRMSFDVLFAAEASVELGMTLGIAGDNGGFPQIQADFFLDWGLAPFSLLNPSDDFEFSSAIQDGLKSVEFRNVSLDVGSYLSNVVSPLVEKIQEITEPIQPIIDIVTTPLPVLSDLGLDITLLDIAKATGSVDPAFIDALETILDVISVLNSIDIPDDGSLLVPFGDFKVYESNNPLYANFGDLGSGDFDVAGFANKLFGEGGTFGQYISGLPDGLQDVLGEVAGVAGEVLGGLADQEGGGTNPKPFRLDILEDPAQVFGLLLGKPAKLVSYDMPKLHFDAEFSAFFSIFGPLGVSINLEAALNIDFAFGYDSKGFADFAASDFKNPLLLANGLYIDDDPTPFDPSDGTDPPELTFDGGLWAAAELNLGIARGGVGGGIFIGVDFNLFDNDHDGRVRLDELFTNFSNQLKAPNEAERFLAPLAVFDVSGKVTAELFAFLKIDFGFFELNKKFNITPPVVLADFDVDFFRSPVLASELDNGDLIINIGDFAGQRKLGDLTDFGEHIFVKSVAGDPGKVEVWSDNLGADAKPHQVYSVNGRIIVVGGKGDDTIDLSGVGGSIKFDIDGGVGNDTILGGAGGGIIRGGLGDDTITGGAGADLIFGNEGGDTIDAKGGNDIVLGDNGDVTEGLIDMAVRHGYVRALVGVSDGADTLYGGAGDDIVAGGGAADVKLYGDDALGIETGNDIVVGDGALFTYNSPAVVTDTEVGAGFADVLISGGAGNDWLYGGKGNDTIHGDAGNDVIFGGSGLDTLDGGTEDDTIFGDFGMFIGGDLAKPVVTVGGEADTIFGGLGADKLLGGGGNDVIHGDNGAATLGDGDIVWGGTGADTLYGDGGNDTIYGESDPDKLFGDDGEDFLEGGNGNDDVKGGLGNDLLVAGYGSDVLDGQEGSDTYRITARGGNITDLTTAYDSGLDKSETDQLVLIGTPQADTVLLRGMADFYFPTLQKLVGKADPDPTKVVEGLTDKIFNSEEPDKLRSVLQALEDSYGPHDIPIGLEHTLIALYTAAVKTGVLAAVDANPGGAGSPSVDAIKKLIFDAKDPINPADDIGILTTDTGQFPGKLEEIYKAITAAYGTKPLPPLLLDAIGAAWDAVGVALKNQLENAITAAYRSEMQVLGTDTDTGFVALINNGGANVERFNYRNLEGITVNTLAGDDIVALDDVLASTTVNLGLGADKVQVGQVFRSERVKDFVGMPPITGITPDDVFTALEITRGWLSNGVSESTTINGGDGADQFTVFHNIAVLNLNGGDGDDVFTVRAFALRGSTDNERARTDMKGDGGADTILYVVNAPVGIDGGDGFDTVRIVGTEFGDDFVVTDAGIFGAGLNVSYVNIEKIVADGAEGDDRFFIQSTGLEVVTEVDGGLGSDTFFVGGNPSGAPVAVISNDFKGHSGIILHSIENAPGSDPDWSGVPIEGVSANVADNEESFVIVSESDGFSRVVEDSAAINGVGWAYDYYGIRLTRAPTGTVKLAVVPAGMSPEDAAKNFKDLQFFWDGGAGDYSDLSQLTTPFAVNAQTGAYDLPTLTFNAGNWDKVQYVKFRAAHDLASEGRRFTFINHSLKNTDSSDPNYQAAKTVSVKVLMEDDDRDGVIVTQSGRDNTVLEDGPGAAGFTDSFDVVLAKAPSANVTVTMNLANSQIALSGPSVTMVNGKPTLTFTAANWNVRQIVTITAPNDVVVEGFHTDYISYTVTSADVEQTLPSGGGLEGTAPVFIAVDGDFDKIGVQPEIPPTKPTSYLLLQNKPIGATVAVKVNGVLLADGTIPIVPGVVNPLAGPARFSVTGNTLSFFDANGQPEFVSGFVTVAYNYKEAGYNGSFVKDSVVDIYDEDTPTVIVRMPDDGSIDVIEGAAGNSDTYTIRLSQAPTAGQIVKVKVDAVDTRSTYGRTALFQEQVTVDGASQTFLTFTSANWNLTQTVTVRAIDDAVFDGNETQVFAPDLQTVNKIRGPLIIEGAAGAGSLSLPVPLMLPGELNILPPHGLVQTFAPGAGAGSFETMTVLETDLQKALKELNDDDSTVSLTDIQVLLNKTLELSSGPGTGVVLDPARPDDKFDRFWQITELTPIGGGLVRLKLLNPSIVNPATLGVGAVPTATTKYAITSLSANFFAKESEQIDYLFVYDNDSVANDNGALTSADGVVRAFDNGATQRVLVEAAALEAVLKLDPALPLVGRRIEITVGPGLGRSWVIGSVGAVVDGTRWITLNSLTDPLGGSVAPTDRSEFRIAGGDTHGRITGFGMGPSILFNGRPQPGGVSYGDIEVVQVSLGRGDDTVRVDYSTNAEDHTTTRSSDFYTLTLLDTGAGNDKVTVTLQDGDDGAFALNLGTGDDRADGSGSSLPLVVFGWDGADKITGGSGDDILFGDRGRVDYVRTVSVDPDRDPATSNNVLVDEIVTRLGHSVPLTPTNPPVTGSTTMSLTDLNASFSQLYGGLVGLSVQAISPQGHVQYRTITANNDHTVTIDRSWEATPVGNYPLTNPVQKNNYFYRISALPEDQTDGLFRGPRVVWSIDETIGGDDTIYAGGGADMVIGGAGNDEVHGGAGADQLAGDDARFDFARVTGNDGPTRLLSIVSRLVTGNDKLYGDDGNDLLIGGLGADAADGGAGNDILLGDAAKIDFAPVTGLGNVIVKVETIDRASGGVDTLRGGDGDDVLAGGAAADRIDGGAQDDLVFGDNVLLAFNRGSLDAIKPRFTTVAAGLYDASGNPVIGGAVAPPYAAPAWADWTITLDPTTTAANFGDDYIAGGAQRDTIFGQRGNDTIQGDGSIDIAVAVVRNASGLQVTPSVEAAATDGDDYIEGNAGADLIFGNLGQDDIVGGSSTMFSLTARTQRDDEADLIFGGAGTDVQRDNLGDGLHSLDADMILGDNGNIRRVVSAGTGGLTSYRSFTYDNYAALKIVVRSAELLDYTPGGADLVTPVPTLLDIGAADELHGESGDDFIYGMTGNDVLFGEGQDDDLIGGWGHDWISGGTGDDGVLGDDGRILTTRNGSTEPLAGLTVATVQTFISTPGSVQSATINVTGQLKKAADLSPFGKGGIDTLFDPTLADDIVYGGWGNDFLHGGWGDDAISGAEALKPFYDQPANAGNVLGYDAATGEFFKYDEYAPMTRIPGFLLNFDANDNAPLDTYPAANTATHRPTDGEDRIFGDYGNDWLVGGTGRDDLYGGWGDDLLNVDDDQGADGSPNTTPDTHYSYEDRAYGGAGRDVLIANTGGDRLIDWVGEFNSFIVPFAPFGQATVSRTLQPQLAEFLYALSASDGADPTRAAAGDLRNGEPYGEIGAVRQQDAAWQDQTGGPRDPQAGNVPGGKRDVLRSADLNDGQLQGLAADSGTWQVSGGALQVASNSLVSDAVAVYQVGDALPTYYEVLATAKIIKPTGGWDANSFIVFDYQSKTNFKFAGIDAGTNKLVIGQRTATGWQVLKQASFTGSIKSDTWYNMLLSVNGLTATLMVDNNTALSYVFQATVVDGYAYGLNWGLVGFGANKSRGALDNIAVQVVPPTATVSYGNDFALGTGTMFDTLSSGNWSVAAGSGRLAALPPAGSDTAVDLIDLTNVTNLKTASLLELSTVLRTSGRSGVVFDWYGPTDFKFAAIDVATQQVLIGHRTGAGWFTDASASRVLTGTSDYTLGVTVRGSSVSVTLNGQAVTGFVYNAVAADGRFGLFAKGAAGASFDAVTVKTNDPNVAAPQTAAASADAASTDASLTTAQLQPLVAEALRRWSLVEDASLTARLGRVEVGVADLPGDSLAEYLDGRITIDVDAGGLGWFIDPTPQDDREFSGRGAVLGATRNGGAAGRIDLLSVLAHEFGHALGFGHSAGGVMDEQRLAGERALPDAWFGAAAARPETALLPGFTATPAASLDRAQDGAAVLIDWRTPARVTSPGARSPVAASAAVLGANERWQQRFVNHLGASSERLHPNAGLKVQVPLAPTLTRL